MPPMLTNLTINAFRQLQGMELRDFGRVNLLVGGNSSGKTSVLESIALFCRPLDPLELINTARRREIKSSRESLLDGVRWLFPQRDADPLDPYFFGEIAFAGTGLFQKYVTVSFEGQLSDADYGSASASDDDESSDSLPAEAFESRRGALISMKCETMQQTIFGGNDVLEHSFELWEEERYVSRAPVTAPQLPVATLSPVSHRVELIQVRQLSEAILENAEFSIIEAIRLIDSDIDNLKVIARTGSSPTLWVHHQHAGFSPVSTLGDGTRRVLTMALQLHSVRGGVLLIDELETAIHKDALGRVFQWLVKACQHFGVQLFATTHSLEAVDALLTAEIANPMDLVAFQLPDRGRSDVKRFDGEILESLRFERGLDIR